MNEKNVESDQKIITKIKHIKNLSPFNRDLSLKQRKSNELTEQNNNKPHDTYSPFNRNQKNNISTEKETFVQRSSNRSRDKDNTVIRKSPINKSKHLTYINNYRKKNINENNNYGVLENNKNMEEIEKKKKLYENQREVPFFRKYIDKIRENGLAENQTSGNRPSIGKNNYNNYSYRENTRNRDKIRDLIENINNKNNRSNRIRRYNEEKEDNPIIDNYTSKNTNDKYYKREIKRDSKNINTNDNKDTINKEVEKDISYRENDKKDKDRKVYQNEYVKNNEQKEVNEIEDNKGNNISENKEDKKECLDNDNEKDNMAKEDINNMEKEEEKNNELKNNDEKEKNEENIHFENNDENKDDIISMRNIKTEDTNDNNNDKNKDKDNTPNLEVDKKEEQEKAKEEKAEAEKDNNIINNNDNDNKKEEEIQNLDKKEEIAKDEIKKEENHENKNEQIMDENKEKKSENENNPEKMKNEEEKKEEDDKDKYEIKKSLSNSQSIVKYENDSIKIDNSSKINITLNESSHPRHDLSKEKKNSPKNIKNIKQIKLIKNKNNSVEVRKKKLHIAHINSHTEDKKFYTSPIKTAENNYNSSELNNEVISAKNLSKNLSNNNNVISKNKMPKLNINSKVNNRENNSSDIRSNNWDNNICLLCNKKSKKLLMCPKCHKVCCEKCIKNKKKKNKFCSFCNYFLNDIKKYIILNNNRNSIQKNKTLKNEENSPHKISGHSKRQMKANIFSQPKNRISIEENPSFRQRNDSYKRNEKTKKVIKHRYSGEKNIHSQKNENDEDDIKENKNIRRTYDNRKTEELFKTKKFYETYIDGHRSKTQYQSSINNKSKGEDIEDFDPNDKKENNNKLRSSKPNKAKDTNEEKTDENNLNIDNNKNDKVIEDNNKISNENLNDENNDNMQDKEEIHKDACLEHNNKLNFYCIQCNKEFCDECINNHMNGHNLIKYSNIDYNKFKNLLTQKNENDNKNTKLQNHLNDFTQRIKSYKLEKDIIISEINKIINSYINNIDLKMKEINEMMEKIKNEQNKIIENNNIINEQLALFYKLNLKEADKAHNIEELFKDVDMNKIAKIGDLGYYSNEIQKINENKDFMKFNYFTSQIMQDIPFNNNGNTILSSKLYFNEENFNDFIYNLKYNNKNTKNNINNNNVDDNPYGIDLDELKEFIFKDESNINSDLFAIRNWKNKALIQINIDLNMNSENEDNDIFYNNINCFLLISNKDLNNYCELNQKLFSKGNLCLYVIIPWEQFNIFNYEHLCFKVIIFNHNK